MVTFKLENNHFSQFLHTNIFAFIEPRVSCLPGLVQRSVLRSWHTGCPRGRRCTQPWEGDRVTSSLCHQKPPLAHPEARPLIEGTACSSPTNAVILSLMLPYLPPFHTCASALLPDPDLDQNGIPVKKASTHSLCQSANVMGKQAASISCFGTSKNTSVSCPLMPIFLESP